MGDHVTLHTAADKFQAKICLFTSFRDKCFIEVLPLYQSPKRELQLSFWSELPCKSLYELQDAPVQQMARKKHYFFEGRNKNIWTMSSDIACIHLLFTFKSNSVKKNLKNCFFWYSRCTPHKARPIFFQ